MADDEKRQRLIVDTLVDAFAGLMEADADAKYLAVWVQGPGTVWIDDLSLRQATITDQ